MPREIHVTTPRALLLSGRGLRNRAPVYENHLDRRSEHPLTQEEVLAAAAEAGPPLTAVITRFVEGLPGLLG